jgi:hypothetical protein
MNQHRTTGRWQVDTPCLLLDDDAQVHLARIVFGSTEPNKAYLAVEGNVRDDRVTHMLPSFVMPADITLRAAAADRARVMSS